VQSTELGTAYLVKNTVTVNGLSNITGAADNQWNSVAIGTINSDTSLSASGLIDGSYKVYTVDAAGNLSRASTDTVTLDTTAPTITSSYSTAENAGTDTTLRQITLLSTDSSGAVTWSNLSGADAALFTLNAGVLTFNSVTNFEAKPSYSISITGTDAAGNASTQALTISLTDVNEAPTTVGSIAAQVTAIGMAYSLDTASFFTDPDRLASIASGYHRLTYSVTSGTFSPSLNVPIAMGYVATPFSAIGTRLGLMVRGKPQDAEVCPMPFTPHHYAK
jgi:hypothetical protein